MTRYSIRLRVLRKSFSYWYPGTDFVNDILNKYGKYIDNNDILVISEKALSIALGNIYDESIIKIDTVSRVLTYITVKILWLRLLKKIFRNEEILQILNMVSLNDFTRHKKLALRYGGLKHFLKPISEAGIDATNLPYTYVSLPLSRYKETLYLVRLKIYKRLRKHVNILVVDTDKSYRLRFLRNMVFSSRSSFIRGVIDLGAYIYVLGRYMRKLFISYPTPVAYMGIDLGLPLILRIAKICEKFLCHGLGHNVMEMLKNLGKKDFSEVTWIDMNRVRHYPVLLIKVEIYR